MPHVAVHKHLVAGVGVRVGRSGGSIELKREIANECIEFIETIMEEITHHISRCLVIATVPIITSVLTYKERENRKNAQIKEEKTVAHLMACVQYIGYNLK